MPSVPLDGFPPEFTPRCPKCEGTSLHFQRTRHPFMWGSTDLQVSCYTCATVKYGEPAVRQVFEPQLEKWRQRQQEEAALQAALQAALEKERLLAEQAKREREQEEAARLAREQAERDEARAQEEARQQRQAAIKALREARLSQPPAPPAPPTTAPVPAPKNCAWHECSNPAQSNSIYCSRVCNNRNAHARYKARRAATPPAPLVLAPDNEGINTELRKAVLTRKAHYETRTTTESA